MINEENNNEEEMTPMEGELIPGGGVSGSQNEPEPEPEPPPPDGPFEDWEEAWMALREVLDDLDPFLSVFNTVLEADTVPMAGLGQRFANPINPNTPPQQILPPSNISILERTSTTISIGWTIPANLPNNVFLISIVYGPNFQINHESNTLVSQSDEKNTFNLTGLEPNTVYYFWLSYQTINRTFGQIVSFSVRTQLASFGTNPFPSPPTVTSQFVVGETNSVVLNWTPVPTIEDWIVTIEREIVGGPAFQRQSILGAFSGGTSVDTDLPNTTNPLRYYLRFYSPLTSSIERTTTVTPIVIPAPGNTAANPIDHDTVQVVWSRPASLPTGTTLTLYRAIGGNGDFNTASIYQTGLTGTTFTDNNLMPSTQYWYWLVFVLNSREGPRVRRAGTTTTAPDSLLSNPVNVSATVLSSSSIRINWTRPSGLPSAATARIYRSLSGTFSTATSIASNLSGNDYISIGLNSNTLYYFWVIFESPSAVSSQAIRTSGTTSSASLTRAPDPTAVSATVIGSTSIRINWSFGANTPTGSTVTIRRGSTSSYSASTIITSGRTGSSFTNTGLTPNTLYYFWVEVVSTGIQTSNAIRVSGTTDNVNVPTPTGASATVINDTSLRLDWDSAPAGVDGTTVYYSVNSNGLPVQGLQAVSLSTTSHTFTGLSPNTRYYMFVYYNIGSITGPPARADAVTQDDSTPTTFVQIPTGVSSTTIDHDSIQINWSRPSSLPANTTARIWRSTSIALSTATAIVSNLTGTTYTDNGLSPSTLYYYWVQFVAPGFFDSQRTRTSSTTNAAPISVVPNPTNVTANVLDQDSIRINWNRPSGLPSGTTARIWQNTVNNLGSATSLTIGLTGTSYTVNGLSADTLYYFWVELESSSATDSTAIGVSARTQAAPITSVPNPTGVSATALSSSSIRIDWTVPSGAPSGTTARIWQATSSSFSIANSVRVGLSTSTVTITGLNDDTLYYFWVELESDSATDSNPIRTSARTAGTTIPTPASPTNVSATVLGETSIRINWTRPSGLPSTARATIRRQVGGSGVFSSSTVLTDNLTGTTFTDTSLQSNTQYWYWVLFIDRGVQGGNVRVTGTTDAPASVTIPAPTNVSATVLDQDSIRINWTRPSGTPSNATATIRRGFTTAFSQSVSVATGRTGTSFTNNGLSASTLYYYWVFFTDGTNTGSSIRVSATTSSAAIPTPPQPDNLRVTNRGTTSIQVQWNEPSGLRSGARATVRFGTTNNFASSTVAITGTSNTTFLISGLQSSTTYYIWVFYQEVNTAGTSAMISTSTRSITVIPVGLTAPNNAWGFDTRPSIASLTEPAEANVWYDGWPDNENNETIYQSQRRIKGTPNVGATMNADGTPFGDWDQPVRIRGPVSTATSAYTIIADPAVSFVSNGNTTTVTVSVTGPETASIVYTFMGTVNGILLQANPVQTGAGHFAHTINTGVSTRMSVVYSASAGSATLASTTFRVDLFRTVQSGGTIRVEIGNQQIDLGVSTG